MSPADEASLSLIRDVPHWIRHAVASNLCLDELHDEVLLRIRDEVRYEVRHKVMRSLLDHTDETVFSFEYSIRRDAMVSLYGRFSINSVYGADFKYKGVSRHI